ncbi:MAG: NB-ARC domain-containing protein [Intestinibacter bartlettii]|uniref:protein kinase domain-containing protein n=1 Tax=Intestinibacter bartlettii TaxID=261299 RepID=UPI0026F06AAC|nr:NB-ARC domain-containing protein [Intestinibacter bartlettii]MDO5011734.1 NB-ARC domain-containing protein [Intestinibacter bartlettii]
MRQALKIGQRVSLISNCENCKKIYEYVIKEVTGFGASCIVYGAYYEDSLGIKHLVRLKEFYPVCMDISRDENLNLDVKDEYKQKFNEEGNLFIKAYKNNTLFQSNLETLNSTGNVQNFLYGNNTMYMVVNYNNGISYDKVNGESIHDIFQIGLTLSKTIGVYHKYGYLHLDIKPENILKLPETNELIILFDFGSVDSIENIHSGKTKNLSYSEKWAAPEQLQHKVSKICEATDIYSIGAVLFYKIMGRIPGLDDRKVFATWEFDLKDKKFEGCNPKIFKYIKELFKNTLRVKPSKRYKSIDELVKILEKLVILSIPNSIYLKSNFVQNDNIFIGRQEEIKLIHDKLKNETNSVFIHGFGGIGKSVLAKQYAFLHKNDYDTILFASYLTSIMDLVLDDREIPITNFERVEKEDDRKYFKRKMDKLYELSDNKTLIILDNFDVDEDDDLEYILNCGCKFIVTTRNDFTDYNYHQVEI